MKALVTGGAGLIGSHLTERLLEDGYQVAVGWESKTSLEEILRVITESSRQN